MLTIATGKQLYIELALNLARSFFWWHPQTDIKFQLVTDQPYLIPADLKAQIQIIEVKPGELGEGFSPKLSLDKLANEGQTLFIDSDCLLFGDLSKVFDSFKGHDVSVVGSYISKGEWFGDIAAICTRFNISALPKFNGGIYYIEKGTTATTVYETARQLERQYDEIGFVRLRNRPNDEVLMALAMQLHHQTPIVEDGTIMSDLQACPGGYFIDVIKGIRWLVNPPLPDARHQSWYPFHKVSPLVVHFLGYYTQHYPYKREVARLKRALHGDLNFQSNLTISFTIDYPERFKILLKDTFRSVYHKLFGTRKIKTSDRI